MKVTTTVKKRARRVARGLPDSAKDRVRRTLGPPLASRRLRRLTRPVRWGSLRRLEPVSARWGFDRGTPVDRYYLDRFFSSVAGVIRGRVLEVRDPAFTSRFGRHVGSVDLVDIDPRNDQATIVADLAEERSLPSDSFDCAILPQTLQFVEDPAATIANLWQSLAPGGALIVTVPALSRMDPYALEADRWRWLPSGLRQLMNQCCEGLDRVEVAAFGNLLTATAFLHGVAAEELRRSGLDPLDDAYVILSCAMATKPGR